MRNVYFLIFSLFMIGCALQETQEQTSSKNTHPLSQEAQKTETDIKTEEIKEPVVTKCEVGVVSDIYTKGKVILYYDNGQKESLNDYCGEGEFGFVIRYFCEGNEAKTRIAKCPDNLTCSKGTCH